MLPARRFDLGSAVPPVDVALRWLRGAALARCLAVGNALADTLGTALGSALASLGLTVVSVAAAASAFDGSGCAATPSKSGVTGLGAVVAILALTAVVGARVALDARFVFLLMSHEAIASNTITLAATDTDTAR